MKKILKLTVNAKAIILMIALLSGYSAANAKMTTEQVLQQPEFDMANASQRANLMQLAKELDITLDPYLAGEVYSKTTYDSKQQKEIAKEAAILYQKNFANKEAGENKLYIATAGAPGVGKSSFIESLLAQKIINPKNVIYVDPDRQSLRFMNGYKTLSKQQSGEVAYEIYRDASNYIANLHLALALYKGYNVVHGTTSTNDRVAKSILPGLKKYGYEVEIHLLFANAEARQTALLHRIAVQDFFQSTKADEKGKVAPVYTRIQDAYIPYADRISVYYNTGTYWLNTNNKQSQMSLRKFAIFNRAKNSNKIIGLQNCDDILQQLTTEVVLEVPEAQKQQEVIAMFNSWFDA